MTPRAARALALALLVGLLAVASWAARSARADGDPEPAPADAAAIRGKKLFDEAVRWVNDTHEPVADIRTFVASLEDVQLDASGNHLEGHLRLWFQSPDKFRQEWRQTRDASRIETCKILDGDRMWVITPDGKISRAHGTTGGAEAIQQVKQDRDRLANLAHFVTLEGLEGPGVTFRDEGGCDRAEGLAGRWQRVRRRLAGDPDITFYFARPDTPAAGAGATYPGVVVVAGNAAEKRATEVYVFQRWKSGETFRFPRRVEGRLREEWKPDAAAARFLLAFPETIRLNVALDASLFEPPK